MNNKTYYPNADAPDQVNYPYYANQAYYGYNQYPCEAQQDYAPHHPAYSASENKGYKFYDNDAEYYWSYYRPEDIDYSKMKASYKGDKLYVYFAKRADIVKKIYSIKAS